MDFLLFLSKIAYCSAYCSIRLLNLTLYLYSSLPSANKVEHFLYKVKKLNSFYLLSINIFSNEEARFTLR